MDEIFKEIDDIGKALDRAKSMHSDDASVAKTIVLSCIDELKKVAGDLDLVSDPADEAPQMSLTNGLTSF